MIERSEPDFSRMSDAELAEWQYAHRDELDDEMRRGEYEPVEMHIEPTFEVTRSFRLPAVDAQLIDEAAERSGLSRSEWIRGVLLAAARRDAEPVITRVELQRVAELLRTAERLVDPALRRAS